MNSRIKILISFTGLIMLLALVWYFEGYTPTPTTNQNSLETKTSADIFAINYDQNLGWTKSVLNTQGSDQLKQETVIFSKNSFVISVSISLIKQGGAQVYTGYIPETREYLVATNTPEKIGVKDNLQMARIREVKGYTLVDQGSLVVRETENTYIYELPIIVSRDGYETKVVVKYSFVDEQNQTSLLEEADKLVLSLNAK